MIPTHQASEKCCRCGKTGTQLAADNDDLRPYGPDGAPICYACAQSTLELRREAATRGMLHAAEVALAMLEASKNGRIQ